ncbi:HAMP domain-containing sensor histidine kinase [Pelagibius sp.]|uniref:sensor histidine kinase n=1 Tax=Pelagibius sp. TaxID=1931238 RepID=UPI0026078D5A|nr:HAMP domain-containing sensor histidine kinase [Pelagibius sp.]
MLGPKSPGNRLRLPPLTKSLSAKLLLLTIFFVMVAEVLIYAPSIGRMRLVYLQERLAAAHLSILALEATPDNMVSKDLEAELLQHVGAYMVALTKPDRGKLMLMVEGPEGIDASYDLREASFFGLIGDAVVALAAPENRLLRIVGPSPKDPAVLVEVVLDEAPMRRDMYDYSYRILQLSLIISIFTAALVYLSLHLLMVRPMRRITASMAAFRENPEVAAGGLQPSERSDEVGIAERELVTMQEGLRAALLQKTRLAALGTAVTKVNHDLRNILATASLISERLARSGDPAVRSMAPTLVGAIDRALHLCAQTLQFTREGPAHLELNRFDLRDLMTEVREGLAGVGAGRAGWLNEVERGFVVEADREQLYRVFINLGRNALEAGAGEVRIDARPVRDFLVIDVEDNGPGLPEEAKEHLFKPFTGSTREGGSGLGLSIAHDIMRAHGGDIRMERSDAEGTLFRLVLPVAQSKGQAAAKKAS